jgi:hypothetical protein
MKGASMLESTPLGDYADLLNRHGIDSPQAKQWLQDHKDDADLVELAQISRDLKAALAADDCDDGIDDGPLDPPFDYPWYEEY